MKGWNIITLLHYWQVTLQLVFMHVRCWTEASKYSQVLASYSSYACICQNHIFEVWNLVVMKTKLLNSSRALHMNSRQITAPNLLWFIQSILFRYELLPLEMTQMKISHVKYLQDVAASQQGWEELVVMCEVGLSRHWSLR